MPGQPRTPRAAGRRRPRCHSPLPQGVPAAAPAAHGRAQHAQHQRHEAGRRLLRRVPQGLPPVPAAVAPAGHRPGVSARPGRRSLLAPGRTRGPWVPARVRARALTSPGGPRALRNRHSLQPGPGPLRGLRLPLSVPCWGPLWTSAGRCCASCSDRRARRSDARLLTLTLGEHSWPLPAPRGHEPAAPGLWGHEPALSQPLPRQDLHRTAPDHLHQHLLMTSWSRLLPGAGWTPELAAQLQSWRGPRRPHRLCVCVL